MIKLTSRQLDLLNKLIINKNITIKEFAEHYSVSDRTIYREIYNINKIINKFKIKIINNKKMLVLSGADEDIINLKLTLPGFTSKVKVKTRETLILVELLQSKEPLKIQYFASKFNVSCATVSYYLKHIKNWLKSNNINLISKPGVGIYIETGEKNIRHAIVDLLYKNYNMDQLIGFIQQEGYYSSYNTLDKLNDMRLLNIIDYKTIFMIEKVLIKVKITMNYKIEDRLYVELIIHIALAINRLKNNSKINLDSNTLQKLQSCDEYALSKTIADYIYEEINLKLPEEEICYITIYLQGMKCGSASLNLNEEYVNHITKKIIENASQIFQIDLRKDLILKKDLSMHLMYSIYRLKHGYSIRNPLISAIKKEYKDIFDKCSNAVKVLETDIGIKISEDEIGYITMHFATSIERMKNESIKFNTLVVCSNGIGISRMLSLKLKRIQELNIIAVSSVLKLDEMIKNNNIDVVISTVPIKRNDVKVIVVNPLFNQNDIKKLESELNTKITINEEKQEPSYEGDLQNLKYLSTYGFEINVIVKNTFFTQINSLTTEGIIEELLNTILNYKLINIRQLKHIKSLLKSREKLGNIILPNKSFAIYHCASSSIKETIVVVGKLKQPITLINLMGKKEKVHTVFLMIAPINKKESLEVIGDLSTSLIKQVDLIDKINKISDTEKCRVLIQEALLKNFYFELKRNLYKL